MQRRPLLIATTIAQLTILSSINLPAQCQDPSPNSVQLPTQILKTGINLSSQSVSPNSLQVSEIIGLTPVVKKLQTLRAQVSQIKGAAPTLENLSLRQDFNDTQVQARQIIEQSNLEIDFVLAEINAERNVYGEILSSMVSKRDKLVARSNAASFYANGVLWAIGEAYDIPTFRYPRLSIPSGTVSILAGVLPSFFDYPTTTEVDYPPSVLAFLDTVPPDSPTKKSRKDQLIDRWLTDQNIPSFTDRKNRKLLDTITAAVSEDKGLSIDTLSARQDMLQQLAGEVMKMKRMVLELSMATTGDKTI
jgi:hypothetical protein